MTPSGNEEQPVELLLLLFSNGETFQTVRVDLPASPSPVFPDAEYDAATDNPTAAEACELPRRQCLHLDV